jgi:hypothetical protein
MSLAYYIAHQIEGRTRLRALLPLQDEDEDEVATLTERLGEIEGIAGLSRRKRTGSLVVEHPLKPWKELLPDLQAAGVSLEEAQQKASEYSLSPFVELMQELDSAISDSSSGRADSRTLVFSMLLLLGLVQLLRGQLAAPATSLFWYAYEMIRDMAKETRR